MSNKIGIDINELVNDVVSLQKIYKEHQLSYLEYKKAIDNIKYEQEAYYNTYGVEWRREEKKEGCIYYVCDPFLCERSDYIDDIDLENPDIRVRVEHFERCNSFAFEKACRNSRLSDKLENMQDNFIDKLFKKPLLTPSVKSDN